jgi:ABC-type transporter Mla MlaB component
MTSNRLVVHGGLDRAARLLFLAAASDETNAAHGLVKSDCSQIDALDEETLGMLVMVARFAKRGGQRLVLDLSSERVRRDLDAVGVSYLFAWSA